MDNGLVIAGIPIPSSAGGSPDITAQPGAQVGQRVFCVVSGVSFEVSDASPHREVDGQTVYFCCDSCARLR